MGLLVTFFMTGNARADRLSNVFFLAFYALAAAAAWGIHLRYVESSALVWVATAAVLVVLAALFVSQALVLAGRIEFRRVAVLQTVAFSVYILWILASSLLALAYGVPPAWLGWLGVAAVVAGLAVLAWFARDPALIKGDRNPDRLESALATIPFVAIAAWLIALGLVS